MGLDDIQNEIINCDKCSLCKTRIKPVVGGGNIRSRVLFIGEAPGKNEDEQGLPFVGRSGQLLDKLLSDVGMTKANNLYLTNIIKCRPPQNRDPKPEEQESCIQYLREQYKIMNPKVVVCLGRIAAQRIIDKNFSVTRQHGTWTVKKGVYFTATFHPSALLRNPNNMQYAEEDFRAIRKKIDEIWSAKNNG